MSVQCPNLGDFVQNELQRLEKSIYITVRAYKVMFNRPTGSTILLFIIIQLCMMHIILINEETRRHTGVE